MKIDEAIEVSKESYDLLRTKFRGLVAHREENGRYYVKAWDSRALNYMKEHIKPIENVKTTVDY